ncbi:bifunctional [glutamate--ammonia ligase]-adenylyl-L-tyrosine phosphorylase/[glutamate--ammonia-ligase] adenylyltransferase [Undibacterium sp. RTI2.1]|uniref:bifunctional [glutamate--ammonia ligase]-adenylyl-L-tyrosine phosphorylase/[glutamate--ammonia-ligase] adenylyltransferase n=1 Tax=unclassified Undibacterium TaxID=2630295 RepID=UPI002AB48921|nr:MULTISPECIES: bifunctional [glutamate--ammonia ligase]-adenylyl-L-tyrosine phosphorylase/[glutamate--ammonia-ligase] adenylyltransferase [unclassified Undibacterium]MDY7538506.1 bifunctional [glutamate--ammonia ligase]-adenylyl-L-tyrosine phosphorylase/[glutamate--ammonia-ligase] adenylyltransferase [Undibacterium sp. 5I1]MEB0031947.1 bifunctional [glutamate--ammonia ligase]-adenylyl-L-tyrosine phosphorylase/[glutamate--ammonia-ligase] adenylyltransferase [Undibacterium sp. RTI2.1]MEB0114869.
MNKLTANNTDVFLDGGSDGRSDGRSDDLSDQLPHCLSRFVSRWLQADSSRITILQETVRLSLSPVIFAQILQKEIQAGASLHKAMRRLRNLVISSLIIRDLNGQADLDEVVTTTSSFADFVVQQHLTALMQEAVALYGTPIGEESGEAQELIVLGMGKLGGDELNVSSDIDLIFCYAENGDTNASAEQRGLSNHEFFSRLGKKLIAAISEVTEDGFSFRVDMALRPNGNSGPLVASFAMVEEYFMVQGREWERYAWVKARALTGKPLDILALDKIIRPFVYRRYLDYGVIDSLRSMHAQIRAEVIRQETRHPERSNNVKLGRGGIREIEFLSQVFQLIRGGREASLRDRSTRNTLRTLAEKNILESAVVDQLLTSYDFLRNLEHRLQYLDDAQTHTFPAKEEDQLIIAQMMGYGSTRELLNELSLHRQFVAEQFDAIFKEKKSLKKTGDDSVLAATLSGADGDEMLEVYLVSLHFHDVPSAVKRLMSTWRAPRLQSLSDNNRNKLVAIINSALALIAKQSSGQLATLNRLLDFIEAIAKRSAYLALLTEYPYALERVVRMMGASDWAAKFLTRHPILLDSVLDETALHQDVDWDNFSTELQQQLDQHQGDTERQMETLREMHHALLFRLLAQDLEGKASVEHLADALSQLADVIVAATIQAAWQTISTRHREQPQFAVIAYGKLGGKELSYASDLDVIFLYDDDDQDAPANYAKLAQRFITWMTCHTPAGILFDVDIALRPDGASGLLVSSVAAFAKYQEKSAWLWEHQALTRARFCAGDARIATQFDQIREQVLRQVRNPDKLKEEVIKMRKKMRDAHPNRSNLFDLKQDAGGMIDIEFIVQFLVLKHAHTYPQLTANIGNIALLKLCGELGLIDATLADQNANAYRLLRKLQHNQRLQGEEQARVAPEQIAKEVTSTRALWHGLLE